MNENEVTEAVCAHLRATGWQVVSRCSTTEQGVDVVAKCNGLDCFVESKCGTSSRPGSARYGKSYTESQVFDRVAKGFYTAACLRNEKGNAPVVGLALPDNRWFRKYIARISSSAKALRITFYWVAEDHSVAEEQPPEIDAISEYEQFLQIIDPLIEEITELSQKDVEFLTAETGIERGLITQLILADNYARVTRLPSEAFYGLFREGLPSELNSLLSQDSLSVRAALNRAIENNIIAASTITDLVVSEIKARCSQARSSGSTCGFPDMKNSKGKS